MSSTRRPSQKDAPKRAFASRQDHVKFWLRRLLIVGVVGSLVMVAIVFFAYKSTTIPNPNTAYQAQATSVFYKGGKTELGRFAIQNRVSIPLADMPQVMQDAVIAAEDRSFYENNGVDFKGILRAAFSNARGNQTQGASTITQQYVKILYLSQERTLRRKVKEAFISLKLGNGELSKSQILEGYLNTIYFGRGAYGVEAASEAYFGHPAKQLSLAESAMLASVLNSPNYLNPDRSPEARDALTRRYQSVLNSMVDLGKADPAEVEKAYGELPKMVKSHADNKYGGQRGFMMTMVKDELIKLGFTETEIEGGGLRVTTTFTRKAMRAAREAVQENRPNLKGLHAATATVDVKTGGLLGFYAGQDFLQSQLNWAKLGNSPGSSFKPFALAAGLEQGFSLKDTFEGNSPLEIGDTEIENQGEDGGSDYGSRVNLIKATEDSINTAYVDLTMSMDDGPQKVVDMARKLGVPRDAKGFDDPGAAITLGSGTVGVIDMANSYASFANRGMAHDWYTVERVVRASDGTELYKAKNETRRAISEDIAADVTYALQQVVKSGSGAKVQAVGRPVAGKTGTSTNDDGEVMASWFVGFTPQVATAVMYTRGNGRQPLDGFLVPFFGGTFPALTWTDVMSAVLDGVEVEDFPPPAYVDGDAPAEGHEPYTPPPPKPKPVDACPNLPGNQPRGANCTPPPAEPVANGVCSSIGYPQDPDCAAPAQPDHCPNIPGYQNELTDCYPPGSTCPPDSTDPDCVGEPPATTPVPRNDPSCGGALQKACPPDCNCYRQVAASDPSARESSAYARDEELVLT